MLSSEWCMQRWSEAIEAGDEKSAKDYQEMYEIWKAREAK